MGKNPYSIQNQETYQASLEDSRLIPFMFVNPFLDDLYEVIKEENKFRGFKLHPRAREMNYHFRNLRKNRITEFLLESEKPIIFHTGYRDISRIKHLQWFAANAKKPVVFAHSGDLIDNDLQLIKSYENVFIDVSPMQTMIDRDFFVDSPQRALTLPKLNPDLILNYLGNLFGKEKIVWGSDTPWSDYLIPDGYKKEIAIGRKMQHKSFKSSYLDF